MLFLNDNIELINNSWPDQKLWFRFKLINISYINQSIPKKIDNNYFKNEVTHTSLSSPRVSSSATDSAIRIAVSIKFLGIFSCDNNAAICNEFKRKHEHANFWTSSSQVLVACEYLKCEMWNVELIVVWAQARSVGFGSSPVRNRHID